MGYDMITTMWHKTEQGTWQEMKLMTTTGRFVDLFPTRDGMLNQVMLGYNRHSYNMEPIAYKRGLPDWYINRQVEDDWWSSPQEGLEYYEDHKDEGTYYDYLELLGYATNPNWNFEDWMETEEIGKTVKRNPIAELVARAEMIVEAYGIYNPKPGDIMIVCEGSY